MNTICDDFDGKPRRKGPREMGYEQGFADAKAQYELKWIPASERLPKPYEQVLRTVKSIGWNGTFHIHVDIGTICPADKEVIAWMPLPEPYKGESEGKE